MFFFALDLFVALGVGFITAGNYSTGYANHRGTDRHFLEHNSIGANARAIADGKRAEYLGASTDNDIVTQGWMALARLHDTTTKRDALIERDIVA